MIETAFGNLLLEKSGILVHGCNCRGKMASGIALQIRQTYPQVYIDYSEKWGEHFKHPEFLLGKVVYTQINQRLIIASAFTQLNYGNNPDVRYVSYDAIDIAFKDINKKALELNLPIKMPMVGAGFANGNWSIITRILEQNHLPGVNHIIFKY